MVDESPPNAPARTENFLGAGGVFYVPALRVVMNRIIVCTIVPNIDCVPLCFRTLIVDVGQSTTYEWLPSNALHAVRNRDAYKPSTTEECPRSNVLHMIRNCNACQPATPTERLSSNARHAVSDRDARQFATTIERTFINLIVLSIVVFG